eukprot:NODE_1637_length_786_cov_87.254932_g1588_i0.p1 GENE.NODE_1637_length_786_cov_87.254932_g1588_i0~~NODE_1637_length_786_cov_87.254932_g1588_i0.p1  ORF type:complete len:193 (-),score=36.44 NODE_1637_length_786_cov_87.254932_g1588_i0:120-698(-)
MAPRNILLVLAATLAIAAAKLDCPHLDTVPDLDVTRYAGDWYEIGTSQSVYDTFERNCLCTQANYTLAADEMGTYVVVENRCRKFTTDGRISYIQGRADILDADKPGELAVTFGPVPASSPNYYVMEVGSSPDYEYALVGEPCRRSLWILARQRTISQDLYNDLLDTATQNGYDIDEIAFRETPQEGCPEPY